MKLTIFDLDRALAIRWYQDVRERFVDAVQKALLLACEGWYEEGQRLREQEQRQEPEPQKRTITIPDETPRWY